MIEVFGHVLFIKYYSPFGHCTILSIFVTHWRYLVLNFMYNRLEGGADTQDGCLERSRGRHAADAAEEGG